MNPDRAERRNFFWGEDAEEEEDGLERRKIVDLKFKSKHTIDQTLFQ